MIQNGIRWTGSFLVNRLLAGIWVPMLAAVATFSLLSAGLAALDRRGAGAWLESWGPPFDFGPSGASEMVDTMLTLQVAVLTLYFSITLLVLTLAAQSLGARLIERWIARIEMRATLAQWAGLVAFSLVAQLHVAPDGAAQLTPRLTVVTGLLLTLMALGWLGFGYHRLVRTAHIDTSIEALGRSLASDRQDWDVVAGPDPRAPGHTTLRAWDSGYAGGFDRDRIIREAARAGARAAFVVPDGGFVVAGDPLARLWDDEDGGIETLLREECEIAAYRADRPTGPFAMALLTEIAARALSPSVNDPQTAMTCADWIGHGLSVRLCEETAPEGWFADEAGGPRLYLPDAGVLAQVRPYLLVLHRAARDHPIVIEGLLRAYGSVIARAVAPEDLASMRALIADVAPPAGADVTDLERARLAAAMPPEPAPRAAAE